jgi:hypothetical protein
LMTSSAEPERGEAAQFDIVVAAAAVGGDLLCWRGRGNNLPRLHKFFIIVIAASSHGAGSPE